MALPISVPMSSSNMRLLLINIFFILCFGLTSRAQEWTWKHWGLQVGISMNLGTHINQVGLKIQGYYTYKFIQLNAGNHLRFNTTNLGKRENFVTQRINTGIVFMAGKRNISPQLILDGLNHQSKYQYALAYNYLWYFDNIGTSQRSGGFGLHIQQFSILIENDILAGTGRDRFRTSYVGVMYHNDLYNISLNTHLWTGETRGTLLKNTPDSIYLKGYKDLRDTPFGRTSDGILSVGFDYQIMYGNIVSALVGVDSEKIRNGLQNKFMHDQVFLPRGWRKPNTIYPMLDLNGFPIHNKENVSPAHPYIQVGINRGLTY